MDEYNRIPTKTQSALLLADGRGARGDLRAGGERRPVCVVPHRELDDLGGGTFPVIEALRDRIDVTVRCTPFDTAQLDALRARLERGIDPEATLPAELIFTPAELDAMYDAVLAVPVPDAVQAALTFFLGQLDFCRRASARLEYMNKDTLHVAGKRLGQVYNEDCPLDKDVQLCTQTENGVSAHAWQSLLHFAKALAWFRGAAEVSIETSPRCSLGAPREAPAQPPQRVLSEAREPGSPHRPRDVDPRALSTAPWRCRPRGRSSRWPSRRSGRRSRGPSTR